jgi:carboxylesterase type B
VKTVQVFVCIPYANPSGARRWKKTRDATQSQLPAQHFFRRDSDRPFSLDENDSLFSYYAFDAKE